MQKLAKKKQNKKRGLYRTLLELIGVGSVTGILAGIVVTFFTVLSHEGERISKNVYAYVRQNPAFLSLLFLTLLAGAFSVGVAMKLSTVIRGGGVPQAEGASRGILPLKWWRDLTLMFATTLLNLVMGLSVGAEGPSVLIGACSGEGVAKSLKRDRMISKYQITGGACVGLAVAMNAPLMGMAFAFEEAHKRFSPEVFICAFTSVIWGMLTRLFIYGALGMQVVNVFGSYVFYELPTKYYGYVLLAGILCGGLGVGFYKLCFFARRLFKKCKAKNPRYTIYKRVAIVVLLGGAVSFLSSAVMGGGSGLIESFGTLGGSIAPDTERVFGLTFVWSITIILSLKFFITAVNVGGGIPCGIFIPTLAIGGCVGALLNEGFIAVGMESRYGDLMLMICMAAFFSTVVKAPLTAIIMICELTGSFAPLLPVIMAVSVGYIIGEMCKTDGIYEELLSLYEEENGLHEREVKAMFTLAVEEGALADKREIKDVFWPAGTIVKEIHRGEEIILPQGDTLLKSGDILTLVCKTAEPEKAKEELLHILG